MTLFAAAWWIRGGAATRPDVMVLGLEVLGLGLHGAGGYMGGTLVTRNLIGADHRYAQARQWKRADDWRAERPTCRRGQAE